MSPSFALRYAPTGRLSDGGDRLTLTARDRLLGSIVVLKVAPAEQAEAERLREEGLRLASLSHPSLLRVTDHLEGVEGLLPQGPMSGFVSPWVQGSPLGRSCARLPLAERLILFGQLVEVVEYLHRAGLLHLDIKPDNVLASQGRVVLLDLGTARPIGVRAGEAGGTLGYAAPEVLAGEAASAAADVYSLGVLAFELLSGESPFAPRDDQQGRRARMEQDARSLVDAAPRVPVTLARFIDRMLSRDLGDRPADLAAVRASLAQLGLRLPEPRGEAPFRGRAAAIQTLLRALEAPGEVFIVGAPGSGRRRLAREGLLRLGFGIVDLGVEADPGSTLGAMIAAIQGPTGARAAAPWSLQHLGVLMPADVDELGRAAFAGVEALTRAGARLIWPCQQAAGPGRVITLSSLDTPGVMALAAFHGLRPGPDHARLAERTGGLPARIIDALRADEPQVPLQLAPSWSLLRALPDGIPVAALPRLPVPADHLAALEAQGLLRRTPGDEVLVLRTRANTELLRQRRGELLPLCTAEDLPALWRDRLGALLGFPPAILRVKDAPARLRPAELLAWIEWARAAVDAERPGARSLLARLLALAGRVAEGLEVLGPDPRLDDGVARALRLQALRASGRRTEARQLLEEPACPMSAGVRSIQVGYLAAMENDLDGVDQALGGRLRVADGLDEDGIVLLARREILGLELGRASGSGPELVEVALAWSDRLAAATLSSVGRLAGRLSLREAERQLLEVAVRRADEEGLVIPAVGCRINLARTLLASDEAGRRRELLEEASALASSAGLAALQAQVVYGLVRLELRAGRIPAARSQVLAYERLTQGMEPGEHLYRGRLNRAWLLLCQRDADGALAALAEIPARSGSPDVDGQRGVFTAWACMERGDLQAAAQALHEGELAVDEPDLAILRGCLEGRLELAQARQKLDLARKAIASAGIEESTIGSQVLLAWATEDQDPELLDARREAFDRAAHHLRGGLGARLMRRQPRGLVHVGLDLARIVELTEAVNDPQAFPETLARLVRLTLGVHRVLIMLRLPGLGQQVGYTELSGAQAAGIGREVLQRIRQADDVWRSGDAFADPGLRRSSQTVRTFEIRSLLAVAIPGPQGRALGALYIDDIHVADRFSDDDVAMLQRLGRAIARLVPLVRSPSERHAAEPVEILGTLLSTPSSIANVREALEMLGQTREANVLITGPTGAGKTVLARRLAVEVLGCRDIETVVLRRGDPQMLVTTLQGSQRGDFTGAEDRKGLLSRCVRERRALFLDEVQNLDEAGQQILLPLLDLPRSFGGLTTPSQTLHGPLHVLLGTNHDVSGERAFEVFRTDLWYRMSRVHIHLPPLAERGVEVVYRYLARMLDAQGVGAPEELLEPSALLVATSRPWRGNLRELAAFAERVALLSRSRGRRLGLEDLPMLDPGEEPLAPRAAEPRVSTATLEQLNLHHVMETLRGCAWEQKVAAARLGLSPSALNKLLKRHALLDEVRQRRQERSRSLERR